MAASDALQAILYALLTLVLRPEATGQVARAMGRFRLYWGSLAAAMLLSTLYDGAGAAGVTDLRVYLVTGSLFLVAVAVGAWGLTTYLLYIRAGRFLDRSVGLLYGLLLVGAVYGFFASDPLRVDPGHWRVGFVYGDEASAVLGFGTLTALVLAVLASLAFYVALYPRLEEPAQRYRVALVSLSILLYFGIGLLTGVPAWSDRDALQFAFRVAAVAAPLVAWVAFRPPAWVQRRLEPA